MQGGKERVELKRKRGEGSMGTGRGTDPSLKWVMVKDGGHCMQT
jgi:hypothetical protein